MFFIYINGDKSFADCLNFIDRMTIYNVEEVDSMDGLGSMRDLILDDYN